MSRTNLREIHLAFAITKSRARPAAMRTIAARMGEVCLGIDTMVKLVEGRADPELRRRVDAHASRCDACRTELSALARGQESVVDAELPPSGFTTVIDRFARAHPESPLGPGDQIGRYVIRDLLGTGGMGVVFAAYDGELDRTVAVKVLRPGMSACMEARLRREAQAMARLAHPNVVAVHDVGIHAGRIFVAMEHVEGETLACWLAVPRPPDAILAVFAAAGAGLAAAHAAGLIHRDFKPENVMIGRDGRVRVSDFGLVRSSHGDEGAVAPGQRAPSPSLITDLTQTGTVLGTPLYMAPEQHRGDDADARSDQFSFCVALYSALYGNRPFDGDSFDALGAAVQAGRINPPMRSVRITHRARAAILRGLSCDPAARFSTLDALLVALARPRRSWRALAVPAIAVIAVGALVLTRSAAPAPCDGAAEHLRGVWDLPRKLAIAAAITGTGVSYAAATIHEVERTGDAYAAGWVQMHGSACRATRVRGEQTEELLGRRMACLDSRLRELRTFGELLATANRAVAESAVAAAHELSPLDDCADEVALANPMPLPRDPQLRARIAAIRATLAEARATRAAGKHTQAFAAVRPLIEQAHAIGYGPLEAEVLDRAAVHAEDTAAFADAARWFEQAALIGEASRHDTVVASALTSSIRVRERLGQYTGAEPLRERARAATARLGNPPDLDAELLVTIGLFDLAAGQRSEAKRSLAAAIAVIERHRGKDDLRLVPPLRALGYMLAEEQRVALARDPIERALAIQRRAYSDDHPEVAITLEVRGFIDYHAARYEQAAQAFAQVEPVFVQAYGADDPEIAEVLSWRGRIAGREGKRTEALALHRRAVALDTHRLAADHPAALGHLGVLAEALEQAGLHDDALVLASSVVARLRKALAADHPQLASALEILAVVELRQRRFALARTHAEQADAMTERSSPPAVEALRTIGEASLALGDPQRAVGALERAALSPTFDPGDRARTDGLLGRALIASGRDPDRGRALIAGAWPRLTGDPRLERARAQLASWLGSGHPGPGASR